MRIYWAELFEQLTRRPPLDLNKRPGRLLEHLGYLNGRNFCEKKFIAKISSAKVSSLKVYRYSRILISHF